jgi:hypothetical protein
MKLNSLPPQYIPFQKVRLGSNLLENVIAVFSINGFIPLLVGDGENPKVWLSIPTNKEGTDWYPLIKENFSSNSEVTVEVLKRRVVVKTPQGTVIHVMTNTESSVLIFLKLDLRPFGLNVYADEGALHVMGNKLAKNEFKNIPVVIGIGSNE